MVVIIVCWLMVVMVAKNHLLFILIDCLKNCLKFSSNPIRSVTCVQAKFFVCIFVCKHFQCRIVIYLTEFCFCFRSRRIAIKFNTEHFSLFKSQTGLRYGGWYGSKAPQSISAVNSALFDWTRIIFKRLTFLLEVGWGYLNLLCCSVSSKRPLFPGRVGQLLVDKTEINKLPGN